MAAGKLELKDLPMASLAPNPPTHVRTREYILRFAIGLRYGAQIK